MPLVKFSNYIRAHADRSFLATCHCEGDACSCNHFLDGHHLGTIHSKEQSKMPTNIESNIKSLSASERKRWANHVVNNMSAQEQRELHELIGNIAEVNAKDEAASERKKAAIARINACKADAHGGRATINLLNGTLRRGNLPSVEELAEKQPAEIMKLFSESSMASADRMACKITLSKLKVIP
jgi:hypothetical protein